MAVNWEMLEAQGIRRSGNKGIGSPSAFVIVGVDISADELLAKFDGEDDAEARAIIMRGAQDTARLRDPIPGWFFRNLATGKPKAIVVYQLIERNKKGEPIRSWPVVFDGRTRTMVMRNHVEIGAANGDASKDRVIEAEVKTYSKESGAGLWASRQKARANHFVAESLAVKAERAHDFHEDGVALVQIADEIGMDFGNPSTEEGRASIEREVTKLLKWHNVLADLCVEAQQRANKGLLRLGAAVRLAKMPKAAQKEALEGRAAPKKAAPRPLSPRTIEILKTEVSAENLSVKTTGRDGFLLGLRLASGDKTAIKDLPDALRAAWLRAQEQAAKKPRKGAK